MYVASGTGMKVWHVGPQARALLRRIPGKVAGLLASRMLFLLIICGLIQTENEELGARIQMLEKERRHLEGENEGLPVILIDYDSGRKLLERKLEE